VISEEMSTFESTASQVNDMSSLDNIGESWRDLDRGASATNAPNSRETSAGLKLTHPANPHGRPDIRENSNLTFTASDAEEGIDLDFKSNGVRPRWTGSRKFCASAFLVILLGAAMLSLYTFPTSPKHLHVAGSAQQLARRSENPVKPLTQMGRASRSSVSTNKARSSLKSTPLNSRRTMAAGSAASAQSPGTAPTTAAAPSAAQALKTQKALQQQQLLQQQRQQQEQQEQARDSPCMRAFATNEAKLNKQRVSCCWFCATCRFVAAC
jgi:hypothetical protein